MMRFEVLMAVKVVLFWVKTPCRLVDRKQCFVKNTVSIFKAEDCDLFRCWATRKSLTHGAIYLALTSQTSLWCYICK
jgi:hypothetical protein